MKAIILIEIFLEI